VPDAGEQRVGTLLGIAACLVAETAWFPLSHKIMRYFPLLAFEEHTQRDLWCVRA
jgi:hypothetical protein